MVVKWATLYASGDGCENSDAVGKNGHGREKSNAAPK